MKYIQQHLTRKHFLFIAIFSVIGFMALQIPVAELAGSRVKFTVYDAFAPIAGSFIGAVPAVMAVFFMQFLNFLAHGAHIEDAGTIIRFFPMLFAALYFAKKGKFNFIVPALAMGAFIAHPIGREVWYFALLWTIPIISYFLRDRFLFARALGSTFTAHAVGGALWIWTFSLPASIWNSLIPTIVAERLLFAIGISVSFVLVNNALRFLQKKRLLNLGFSVYPGYLLKVLRNHHESKTSRA